MTMKDSLQNRCNVRLSIGGLQSIIGALAMDFEQTIESIRTLLFIGVLSSF